MRRTAIILIMVLLVGGCRTNYTPYEAQSLTGQYYPSRILAGQSELDTVASGPNSAAPVTIQLVTYQQEVEGDSALEPLPDSQIESPAGSALTLMDLEEIALQNSPVLVEAEASLEAARGGWVQAGLPPNPRLGYSGEEIGDTGSAGQQGGFVAQEFVTADKLGLNRQVAAWRIQRLEQELEAARLSVLTDVRIGYYDVLIAQRRRELAGELVRISQQGVEAAQALFKGEEVSEADPLRARVDEDSARIVLQNVVNQHLEAWRRLRAVLGMPEMSMHRVDGELGLDDMSLSWEEELQRVLSESPEISAAIADVEGAHWAIELAHAELIPNIDVEAAVQRNDVNGETITSVQIALPMPILNRNQGGIQRAQADAAAAEWAVDRVALDLQVRLASAFRRYESARNQVEKYSRAGGIIANSRRTLELIRAGYQADEFSVLDLLTAQRTYFQTNLAYLDSLHELSTSAMEIRGLLLKGSLSE